MSDKRINISDNVVVYFSNGYFMVNTVATKASGSNKGELYVSGYFTYPTPFQWYIKLRELGIESSVVIDVCSQLILDSGYINVKILTDEIVKQLEKEILNGVGGEKVAKEQAECCSFG